MQKELLIFGVLIAVIAALFNFTAPATEVTAAGELNNSDNVVRLAPSVRTRQHPQRKRRKYNKPI